MFVFITNLSVIDNRFCYTFQTVYVYKVHYMKMLKLFQRFAKILQP